MKASENQDDLTAFEAETTEERSVDRRPYETHDRFDPEFDILYSGLAIIQKPKGDIPSNKGFGPSTVTQIVDLENGNRMVWWLSNRFEQEHLHRAVNEILEKGGDFPIEVKFSRRKKVAQQSGNTYNQLLLKVVAWGDDVKGDLGVAPHEDPSNDGSPMTVDRPAPTVNAPNDPASLAQWQLLKKSLGDKGVNLTTTDDVILSILELGIEVGSDELCLGDRPLGTGTLNKGKASDIISALIG
jgi:hypothetical protein